MLPLPFRFHGLDGERETYQLKCCCWTPLAVWKQEFTWVRVLKLGNVSASASFSILMLTLDMVIVVNWSHTSSHTNTYLHYLFREYRG